MLELVVYIYTTNIFRKDMQAIDSKPRIKTIPINNAFLFKIIHYSFTEKPQIFPHK